MAQEALLSRINELPRIQKVLQDLLNMVNEDEVDFEQLSKKYQLIRYLAQGFCAWLILLTWWEYARIFRSSSTITCGNRTDKNISRRLCTIECLS